MKTLSIILILIQVLSSKSQACDYNNDAIKSVIEAAEQVESFVDSEENYNDIGKLSLEDQQALSAQAMKPISPKRGNDYNEVGVLQLFDKNNIGQGSATGVKISNKCVLTSAHFLYGSTSEATELSKNNRLEGRINFVRGGSVNKKVNAKVFYQMTNLNEDYVLSADSSKRIFYGHNDLVILKLESGDNNYRQISVVNPNKFINKESGNKITCQGMPRHMTENSYGSCKGSSFLWEQKNARAFIDDKEIEKQGLITNLAATKGMSGGPCTLDEKQNKVFGVVSNGFTTSAFGKNNMPAIKFKNENYINQGARYVSLLHILDKRMKSELGYGLDKLIENCDK